MLAASLALTIAWAQAPPRVTVVTDCENAALVVSRLAQASGQRLDVGGSVKQDWLAIKFTDVSIEDAKARLAVALDAEWLLRSDGVFELTRSAEFLRRRERERRQAFAAKIRMAQSEMKIAPPVTADEAERMVREVFRQGEFMAGENRYERVSEFNNRTPIKRMADRLLLSLDANWIAENADSEDGCWLTIQGRGRIFSLPASGRAIIQDYLNEQQIVNKAASQLGLTRSDRAPRLAIYGDPGTVSVSDVRIGVNVSMSDDQVVLMLELYTPAMLARLQPSDDNDEFSLNSYTSIEWLDSVTAVETGAFGTDSPLEITPDFEALIAPIYQIYDPGATGKLPARTAEIFRDLVANDPLTIITRAAIRDEFARTSGDRILLLPDMIEPMLWEKDEFKGLTSRRLWGQIQDSYDFLREDVLGSDVVRTALPDLGRRGRWPRQAMSDLYRKLTTSIVTIEDLVPIIQTGDEEAVILALLLPILATGPDLYVIEDIPDLTPYRLFGTLNRNQRAVARQSGLRIRLNELSAEARQLLEATIIEPNEFLEPLVPDKEDEDDNPADYLFDRGAAFLFADGFPADAFLDFRVDRVERFFVRRDEAVQAVDIENLAYLIVYREMEAKESKQPLDELFVAVSSVEEVNFVVTFPRVQKVLEASSCLEIPLTPRVYKPLRDLPPDVRKRLDVAIAKARSEIGGDGSLLRQNHG